MKKTKEIENRITNLEIKGEETGLTLNDYNKIKVIHREIKRESDGTKEWSILLDRINYLTNELYKAGLLNNFSKEDAYYITEHSYLLPLVLVNSDSVKFTGRNYFKVNCPFHEEVNNDLLVTDIINQSFCYKCDSGYGAVKYLQQKELLSYKDTISLLAGVYLFKIKGENKKLEFLIKKYQEKIINGEYKELLDKSYEKLTKGDIKIYHQKNILEEFNKRYETIGRVKNHIYDPNFKYDDTVEIVKIKKQ